MAGNLTVLPSVTGIAFKDLNLGIRLRTFLCATLKCIQIWDSLKNEIPLNWNLNECQTRQWVSLQVAFWIAASLTTTYPGTLEGGGVSGHAWNW